MLQNEKYSGFLKNRVNFTKNLTDYTNVMVVFRSDSLLVPVHLRDMPMTNLPVNQTDSPLLITAEKYDERVAENLHMFFVDREAASENTWAQMKSVLRSWGLWCKQFNKVWLPAAPEDVREYLIYLRETLGRKKNTIAMHKSMINKIHREAGLALPASHILVTRGMKKISRQAVLNGERVEQAIPLHLDDLFQLAEITQATGKMQQLRDLAFLGVAYNTLLRMSEVARLRIGDIQFQRDGSATLDVGYTKTIKDEIGVVKVLAPDVAGWLRNWLNASGLTDESTFIFGKVDRYGNAHPATKPMAGKNIEKIFAKAWEAVKGAPLESSRYRTWTGHSPRVGAAQDMALRGTELTQIMHEGTWKRPEQVMSYIRYIDANKSVMLDIVNSQRMKR